MNSCKQPMYIYLFCLLSMIFLTCGASHKLVDDVRYKEAGFTYENLKQNGLIVSGMSSDVIKLSDRDRLDYSLTFSNVLIGKLRDASMIRITNPQQLIADMGQEAYFTMMEDFDHQKALSRTWADTLRDILPDVRYILFAFIANENIVDEASDYVGTSATGEEEISTEYKKTYYITVDFLLYDLQNKSRVWENSIFNKAHRTESRSSESGCLESCVNDIIQNILFGEPAEISREEVFVKIVEKFAEDISKS